MGKKKRNQKNKQNVSRLIALKMDRKVDVPFRAYDATANVTSVRIYSLANGSIGVNSIVGNGTDIVPRLLAVAPNFTLFKFRRLTVFGYPSNDADYAVAYMPNGGGITAPASIATMMELPHAMLVVTEMTVPRRMNINKQALAGQFPWYRVSTSVDAQEYIQGYVFLRGGATSATPIVFEGVVCYKEPTNAAIALQRIKDAAVQEFLQSKMIASTSVGSPALLRN